MRTNGAADAGARGTGSFTGALVGVHFGAPNFKVGAAAGEVVDVGLVTGAPRRLAGGLEGVNWHGRASGQLWVKILEHSLAFQSVPGLAICS
jgi:hypothetical protein